MGTLPRAQVKGVIIIMIIRVCHMVCPIGYNTMQLRGEMGKFFPLRVALVDYQYLPIPSHLQFMRVEASHCLSMLTITY